MWVPRGLSPARLLFSTVGAIGESGSSRDDVPCGENDRGGDPMQTDLKNKEQSGFKAMFDLFNDEESKQQGIHCVEFTKDDIMRSEILKFIIEKVEKYNSLKPK